MKKLVFAIFIMALLMSCVNTARLTYFRDIHPDSAVTVTPQHEIRLLPGDKISVVVNSKDQKLASLFNLSNAPVGNANGNNDAIVPYSSLQYTVDASGNIDFPVMGTIRVGGLTRDSVAKHIKSLLVGQLLLTDAVVNVEFANLYVSVLGEVRLPGRYPIKRDWFTIIDAISMAGDLTTNGDRAHVLVMRREGNLRRAYRIDMRSAKKLYSSPAYYLRQGDVVYIEPLRAKRGE